MRQPWRITIWGVRGSFPMARPDYMAYGGNTSCISAECGGAFVVLDAGSGLAQLGEYLLAQEASKTGQTAAERCLPVSDTGRKRVDILISHMHLDHVMGLFSFAPFHRPDWDIHLYGEAGEGVGFFRQLRALLGKPFWPLGIDEFQASVTLHEIRAGESFSLPGADGGRLTVRTLRGRHPGGSVYFCLEGEGRGGGIVYALDCEPDETLERELEAFAKDAELLIWDAGFAPGQERPGWGHSTWRQGLQAGRRAGAKRVLMTHYAIEYDDAFLQEQETLAGQEDKACLFAREGMVIRI